MCEYNEDKKIYEMFHNGDVDGISIYDNEFCKHVFRAVKPNNICELKCILVLDEWYHLLKMDKTEEYVCGKGESPVTVEEIEKILSPTRGLLMWRNQLYEILNFILDYDIEQAKQFRKDMGLHRFDSIKKFEKEFMAACQEKQICSEEDAGKLMSFIEDRTIYTMDEEHYEHLAFIAYHSMCWKYRFPTGFANYMITIGGTEIAEKNDQVIEDENKYPENDMTDDEDADDEDVPF